MFVISGIIILFCVNFVMAGFIDVQEDRLVSVEPEESFGLNETERNSSKWDAGEGRSLDSKDMLLPLIAGVVLKIFSVAPLLFALLGWLAGLGLTAGKLSLILFGGLGLHYYLSQNSASSLLAPVPVTKHLTWDHSMAGAGAATHSELNSQLYQQQQQEELFHRDRVMHTLYNSF